jgi:uncharacterized protein YdeI (YjbR/CyaY-like superfamily)
MKKSAEMNSKPANKEYPVLSFDNPAAFRKWLEKNHADASGIWLRMYKKKSGVDSINYDLALDEALCYGWIDGQVKTYDEQSYIQRFTPRRSRSIWSKRNIEHVKRLEGEGRMRAAGKKEAEAAMADGRWDAAYDSPSNMDAPQDLLDALSKDTKAEEFFNSLNKTNKYAINWRLQTAKKPETREKRLKEILEMLSKGQKFH